MLVSYTLHEKALGFAKEYLKSEKELLSVLIEMDEKRVFWELKYTGVFNYCLKALLFSESQANYFASIVRKSREVPELKAAINQGEISISKARRIVPVITVQTHREWINKAKTLTQKELKKEVAGANPRIVKEGVKPVSQSRYELKLGIGEELHQHWQSVRDLVSKKKQMNLSMEETFEHIVEYFLEHEDPVLKASRALLRAKPDLKEKENAGRKVPTRILHQVNLRDQGKCQVVGCENQRFTEMHHIKPFSLGGIHRAQNLMTLCSAHHKIGHRHGLGPSPDTR